MAAWAIHQGEKCLSISTDGGFWLGDPKFENSDLHKALVPYHSGIRFEGSFDELFVARNRVYVAWNRGQVLHCAMMGIAARGSSSDEKKLNFQNMIRQKLTEGRDHRLYDSEGKEVREEVTVKRLTGLNDFLYKGIGLNSAEFKPKKISWNPDFKRKLLNADVNIFKDWTETAPYNTVEDAFRDAFNVKPVGRPKVVKPLGRPEALPKAFKAKLLTPEFQVLTHRQAAAKLGVSVSTVKRERERLRGER